MLFLTRAARWVAISLVSLGVAAQSAASLAQGPVPASVSAHPLDELAATGEVPSFSNAVTDDSVPAVELQAPDARTGDVTVFPTLAAAVAAQATDGEHDRALRCLAGAIYFESRGEPLAGQLGVAQVILNRAASGRFADNVCDVITQPGQFGFVRGGQIPAAPKNANWRRAIAVAKVAMADAWDGAADKALFFNTTRPTGAKIKVAAIGNHLFYR